MARDCLNVVKGSERKEALRKELQEALDERIKALDPALSEDMKAAVAIREISEEQKLALKQKRFQAARKFRALQQGLARLDQFPDDPARGLRSIYAPDKAAVNVGSDVTVRGRSIYQEITSEMPTLAKVRPKLFRWGVGVKQDFNRNIIKESGGINTGDEIARNLMLEISAAVNKAAKVYRAAGGQLGELPRFFLPQNWDPHRMAGGKEQWTADALAHLDRERMLDLDTGARMTERQLSELLDAAFDNIVTDGATKKWLDPDRPDKPRSIAKKRDRARVLHFTQEGEAFMRQKYMDDNIVEGTLLFIQGLSRDAGIMQIMGPDPEGFFRALRNSVKHRAQRTPRLLNEIQLYHDFALGHRKVDASPEGLKYAMIDQAARSITQATYLGGALIPSLIGDNAFGAINRLMTGAKFFDGFAGYFKTWANTEEGYAQALREMRLIDTLNVSHVAISRFDPDLNSRALNRATLGQRLVFEKSGLDTHSAGVQRMAVESHHLAIGADLGKSWDQLAPVRRGFWQKYNISEEIWNNEYSKIKAGIITDGRGKIQTLDLPSIRASDPEKFRRLHEIIILEAQESLLEPNAQSAAGFTKVLGEPVTGQPSSTLKSQLAMFKSHPVRAFQVLSNHFRNPHVSRGQRAYAFSGYLFVALLGGVFHIQAKQFLAGRDFIDMDDPQFCTRALLAGGGIPLFGDTMPDLLGFDLASGKENRKGVIDILPTLGLLIRTMRPTWEAGEHLLNGDYDRAVETLTGEQMAELGRVMAALSGGNIWYIRTFLERVVFDQLEEILDPKGFADKRRARERWLKSQGQTFFWRPGDLTPRRGPEAPELPQIGG